MASSRAKFLKFLIPVVVILLLIAGGLSILKSQLSRHGEGTNSQDIEEGSVLPDFNLKRLDGTEVKVSSLGAQVMLINFWATWCEACMVEMPTILKLYESYKSQGFEVLAVDVDENPETVVPKVQKQLKMTFQIFTDTEGKLSELFDVHAIPLSVVIDKNRKVLMIESGERDWNSKEIRTQLEQWLKS